jgi:DNA-binding transcriptional MerR regulator
VKGLIPSVPIINPSVPYKPAAEARRGGRLPLSSEEIRTLLTLREQSQLSCEEAYQLARRQLAAVKQRIAELESTAAELERTIESCARQSCGDCSILDALQH